jgi:hypothetical protein
MTARTINDLFYDVSHYDATEELGNGVTTLNDQLEAQYIPIAVKVYNALTDEGLTTSGTDDAITFGDTYEFENQVAAYVCAYLAEVDMHPKEFRAGESAIWDSKYMQQALQLVQMIYPDRVKAQVVGGRGMVWILNPDKRNNISLIIGVMRSSGTDRPFGTSEPGYDEPTSTTTMMGR